MLYRQGLHNRRLLNLLRMRSSFSSQFDEYLPPYLLESSDSGTTFAPCAAASGVSNKEAADLLVRPRGATGVLPEVCVATIGDGLQCFSLGNQ